MRPSLLWKIILAHMSFLASRSFSFSNVAPRLVRRHYAIPRVNLIEKKMASCLLPFRGSTFLVCVSGGLDSTALLRLLRQACGCDGFNLEVIHFNHGIRKESCEEAEFVRDLAAAHGLPFHLREASSEQVAQWTTSGGMQRSAREWRRREAAALLPDLELPRSSSALSSQFKGERYVVTAHHRDDQSETILLKILRGVHLSNIRGMEVCSPYPNEYGAKVLRPLVDIATKQDLLDFAESIGQSWHDDPSNESNKYKRNQIRQELVPLLEELTNNGLSDRLGSLEGQSRQLRVWLEDEATAFEERHLTASVSDGVALLPVEPWLELPSPVRTEVLHRLIATQGSVSFEQLQRVEAQASAQAAMNGGGGKQWELHLPGSLFIARSGAFLRVGSLRQRLSDVRASAEAETPPHRLHGGGCLVVSASAARCLSNSARSVRVFYLSDDAGNANEGSLVHVMQGTDLELRLLKDGDIFSSEHSGHSKVVAILRRNRVPLHERGDTIVLAEKGKKFVLAFWVPPYGSVVSAAFEGNEPGQPSTEATQRLGIRIQLYERDE